MTDLYDYGPPVTVGEGPEDGGTPADTTGEVTTEQGESPHDPPPDAATIVEPGGSPSDEVVAANTPSVASLSPSTAVTGSDVDVTVSGERFTPGSGATCDGSPVPTTVVSNTELTATLPVSTATAGTLAVGVQNGGLVSNTVDFTVTATGRR